MQQQLQVFIDTWSRSAYTVHFISLFFLLSSFIILILFHFGKSEQSLEFLEKFQRLDGVKIDYNNQYTKLLQEYTRELEAVCVLIQNKIEILARGNV